MESVPVGSAAGCFGEGAFFCLSVLIREEAPRPLVVFWVYSERDNFFFLFIISHPFH